MNKEIIVKSNDLVGASYTLTLHEQRLILAALAQIDSKTELDPLHLYEVKAVEINDLLKSKTIYEAIKTAVDKLYERSITVIDTETGNKAKFRWISRAEYLKGEGTVRIRFTPEITPFISDLKKRFTQYKYAYVKYFKSSYTIRIYEMCLQWQSTGFFEIGVDELREKFELQDKYKTTAELRRKTIDVAMREINKYSDIEIKFGQRKTGRAISHFQFSFKKKEQNTTISNKPQTPLESSSQVDHDKIMKELKQAQSNLEKKSRNN